MGLHRTHRRNADRLEAIETKARNRSFKDPERDRRDARMGAAIKAGTLPYHPAVMSWLSRKLDKPSTKITPQDVKFVLSEMGPGGLKSAQTKVRAPGAKAARSKAAARDVESAASKRS